MISKKIIVANFFTNQESTRAMWHVRPMLLYINLFLVETFTWFMYITVMWTLPYFYFQSSSALIHTHARPVQANPPPSPAKKRQQIERDCRKILSISGRIISGRILLERKSLRGSKEDGERPKECLKRIFKLLEDERLGTVEVSQGRYKVS